MKKRKKRAARERPSWDEFFIFSALLVATRSSCLQFQTGSVIVKDKRIISSGYNGAPPGIKNCLERGCRKEEYGVKFEDKGRGTCRGNHAEYNAMNQIARQDLIGTTLYTLYYPCSRCAKQIVGSGIQEVIYSSHYEEPDSLTEELFRESGTKLRKLDLNVEKYFRMIKGVLKEK